MDSIYGHFTSAALELVAQAGNAGARVLGAFDGELEKIAARIPQARPEFARMRIRAYRQQVLERAARQPKPDMRSPGVRLAERVAQGGPVATPPVRSAPVRPRSAPKPEPAKPAPAKPAPEPAQAAPVGAADSAKPKKPKKDKGKGLRPWQAVAGGTAVAGSALAGGYALSQHKERREDEDRRRRILSYLRSRPQQQSLSRQLRGA